MNSMIHILHYYRVMFEKLIGQKGLSLDRLATLCHIAEAGSIGVATGDNSNRQTLYSRQIKELEGFLGVDLLDRESRPHRVTEQGLQLALIARNYLTALDDFIGRCRDQPARIVVGAGESLIQWALIPTILPRLRKELPEASVAFLNYRSEPIIHALQTGELDVGFVRKSAVPKTLKSVGSMPLGYRLFVPKKFRTKLSSPVRFKQLADIPVALLDGGGKLRSTINELANDAGVKLNVVAECSSLTQLALLVARKECCAFLPGFAKSQLDESTTEDYSIEGFKKLERTMCFAWSPKRAEIRPIVEKVAKICGRR
jgi:DNA-binding transcriptional LysR family regulator